MKNMRIKTKRDWCIAAIFTIIIVYAISTKFSQTFQSILLKYGNPMLTNMNQPKSYGNIMFTIAVMIIIVEIVLFIRKKPKWIMCVLAVCGIAAVIGVFYMYLYNVDKIVSVIEEEEGGAISIGYWAGDELRMDEEKKKEIVELCEKLEPVSDEEQERLKKEYSGDEDFIPYTVLIWATYPEKYGHNFDLMVCVHKDNVFVRKGYDNKQELILTFYEDNGLVEKIKE